MHSEADDRQPVDGNLSRDANDSGRVSRGPLRLSEAHVPRLARGGKAGSDDRSVHGRGELEPDSPGSKSRVEQVRLDDRASGLPEVL